MNILFCTGGLTRGGAERVICNLSNYLCKNNNIMILGTTIKEPEYFLKPKIQVKSLDNIKSEKKNFLKTNIDRLKTMYNIILEYKPDVIVTFLREPTARVMLLKKYFKNIKKIPVVISVRCDPTTIFKGIKDKIIVKLLYKEAEGYVFQTEEAKRYFNKEIQKRSTIIANPINDNFICKEFNGMRKKNIVMVGRLTDQKNPDLAIEAFNEIVKTNKSYKLIIYGEGILKNNIEEKIKRLNLQEHIILKGNVQNIKEEIYDAKIFILCSNYEGLPNSLLEAMALGLPCIATDSKGGGSKALIDNNVNGILIKCNDKDGLVQAMNKIINNSDFANYIGKEATKIKKKYNPKIINKKWEKYLIKIGENRNE